MISSDRFSRAFWRFFAAALFIYVAIHLAIRSPWFRVHVERRLSAAFGLPVRVSSIRATESLNLQIRGIHALSTSSAMDAAVLRVRWSFFPRSGRFIRLLRFEDLSILFAPDASGRLCPAILADAPLQAIARFLPDEFPFPPIPQNASPLHPLPPISVLRGEFIIRDALGRDRLRAADLEFEASIAPPSPSFSLHADAFSLDGYPLPPISLSAVLESNRWSFVSIAPRPPR